MSFLQRFSLLLFVCTLCNARPDFKKRIPNGEAWARMNSGINCGPLGHNGCVPGNPRNAFGLDFKAAGFKWTKALCEKDSDGDGLTNGEELGDPCCMWSADKPTRLRLTMLSHPGDRSKDGAKKAPKCGKTMPKRPASPIPNVCGAMRKSVAVACLCFATFRKMVTVPMKNNVLKMCKKRFGGNAKLNMLRSACDGFRNKNGALLIRKIVRSVALLKRCPVA